MTTAPGRDEVERAALTEDRPARLLIREDVVDQVGELVFEQRRTDVERAAVRRFVLIVLPEDAAVGVLNFEDRHRVAPAKAARDRLSRDAAHTAERRKNRVGVRHVEQRDLPAALEQHQVVAVLVKAVQPKLVRRLQDGVHALLVGDVGGGREQPRAHRVAQVHRTAKLAVGVADGVDQPFFRAGELVGDVEDHRRRGVAGARIDEGAQVDERLKRRRPVGTAYRSLRRPCS